MVSLLAVSVVDASAERKGYRKAQNDYRKAVRNAARAERKLDKRNYDRRDVRDAYRAGAVSGAVRNELRHNARHRYYRNIAINRPHGHWYHGYGGYHQDNDAFKWLALTAISLKILDMVNEDQQRRHEQAMIDATTAQIGTPVTWRDGNASGRVVAVNETRNSEGLTCREFQQEIRVGGKREDGYGTACLQPDGSWQIVN
jgi:hypothetical protein